MAIPILLFLTSYQAVTENKKLLLQHNTRGMKMLARRGQSFSVVSGFLQVWTLIS